MNNVTSASMIWRSFFRNLCEILRVQCWVWVGSSEHGFLPRQEDSRMPCSLWYLVWVAYCTHFCWFNLNTLSSSCFNVVLPLTELPRSLRNSSHFATNILFPYWPSQMKRFHSLYGQHPWRSRRLSRCHIRHPLGHRQIHFLFYVVAQANILVPFVISLV